jgi:hypothetical protein
LFPCKLLILLVRYYENNENNEKGISADGVCEVDVNSRADVNSLGYVEWGSKKSFFLFSLFLPMISMG